MRIKLLFGWKQYKAGDTIDSPDSIACALINTGIAEQLDPPIKSMKYPPNDKMIRGYNTKQNKTAR